MTRTRATILKATLLLAVIASLGCLSVPPRNVPLAYADPSYGYRTPEGMGHDPGDIMLVLALSGGGTRAAAFSYGVLQELRDTPVPGPAGPTSLLDEIDLISSVSGGSFVSAYYGLFGDRIFEDFEPRFLRRDVEGDLALQLFKPINWFRLASSTYGRSDLAVEFYHKEIFDQATFADLPMGDGAHIEINATDLSLSSRFTFLQETFDAICSDLGPLEVARAVAASSAVPVLLSPITLKNYAGECGYEQPAWQIEGLKDRRTNPRLYHNALSATRGQDREKHPYLHLVDGGIADNLGVRGPLAEVRERGGLWRLQAELPEDRPWQVVVISVNSVARADRTFSLREASPTLPELLGAVTDVQMGRYSFETLALLHDEMKKWAEDAPPHPVHGPIGIHLIELDFNEVEDPEERHYLNNVGTNFHLDDEAVDRLIAAGRKLLRDSPAFQELLKQLAEEGEEPKPSP
jgi:NTE family protein